MIKQRMVKLKYNRIYKSYTIELNKKKQILDTQYKKSTSKLIDSLSPKCI